MSEQVPLRLNARFQLLWAGSAVSQLGTELTRLAMPLLVLALTGSPGLAGLVAGARTASFIAAQIPAGVWVDRWDRRRTLVLSGGVQFVAAAVLAALIVLDRVSVWEFVVLAAVDGVCTAFGAPARMVAIRMVVPDPQLRAAYTQDEARTHAAWLAGPPLGGLLYGLGRALPFVVDMVTFLVAFVCSVVAKVPRYPAGAGPKDKAAGENAEAATKPNMWREATEALRWLWREAGLRELSFAAMLLNLLGSAYMIPLIVMVNQRGGGAFNTGTVLAGIGVGGLIGALLSNRLGGVLGPGKLIIAIFGVFGVSMLAMTLPFGPWWPVVPLVMIALSTPTLNVVMNVVLSRMVPEAMLARVDAVLNLAQKGLSPLAPVFGGALAAALGGAGAIAVIGTLLLATAGVAAVSRALRQFTGESEVDEPAREAVRQPGETGNGVPARTASTKIADQEELRWTPVDGTR